VGNEEFFDLPAWEKKGGKGRTYRSKHTPHKPGVDYRVDRQKGLQGRLPCMQPAISACRCRSIFGQNRLHLQFLKVRILRSKWVPLASKFEKQHACDLCVGITYQ